MIYDIYIYIYIRGVYLEPEGQAEAVVRAETWPNNTVNS